MSSIEYRDTRHLPKEGVLALYRANDCSSADNLESLLKGLLASHSLFTAWDGSQLVGLGNALSDGHLVVYYSHLLVLPTYQSQGIGRELMRLLLERYAGFHQHVLLADGRASEFYRSADSRGQARRSRCGSMLGMIADRRPCCTSGGSLWRPCRMQLGQRRQLVVPYMHGDRSSPGHDAKGGAHAPSGVVRLPLLKALGLSGRGGPRLAADAGSAQKTASSRGRSVPAYQWSP